MSRIQPQDKLHLLRQLLLADERKDIIALREELDDLEKSLDRNAAKTLTDLLREQGGPDSEAFESYVAALQEGTESSIERSVRTNRTRLANALFPIMGPAIRSYVAEMFRSLAEDLNRTLQNATSVERLRWRFQARVSGVPFSEYVALRTGDFRVEELYLMEKSSGLLIQHLTADGDHEALNDPDLTAGMLTAIRSFTRDVFGEDHNGDDIPDEDRELDRFTLGGRQVLIEGAPTMVLAAVVHGTPPATVRGKLKTILEALHQSGAPGGEEEEDFDADERSKLLEEALLEAHTPPPQADSKEASNDLGLWRAWLFLGILAASMATWFVFSVKDRARWSRYADQLRAEPGIEVLQAEGRRIMGLRDPLAIDPLTLAPDPEKAELTFAAYHSLHPGFVARREQSGGSTVTLDPGLPAPTKKLAPVEQPAAMEQLAAMEERLTRQLDAAEALRRRQVEELLTSRFAHLDGVIWHFSAEGVRISGGVPEPHYSQIIGQLGKITTLGPIDSSALESLSAPAPEGIVERFSRTAILYEPGKASLSSAGSVAKLRDLIAQLDETALASGHRYQLRLLSHPLIGSNRNANRVIERQRGEDFRRRLISAGIAPERLMVELSEDFSKAGSYIEVVPVKVEP